MECGMIIFVVIGAGVLIAFIQISNTNAKKKTMTDYLSTLMDFTPTQQVMSCDGSAGIAVDEGRKKICLLTNPSVHSCRVFSYKDLLSVEIFEDGDSITKTARSSQIGGALLGGLVLGGVGAMIGGLSGKTRTTDKVKQVDLRLIVNDTRNPLHDVKFLNIESKKDGFLYKTAIQSARHWHGVLEILIKRADSEETSESTSRSSAFSNTQSLSIADELKKLGELNLT